jgi:hypothetical protein
MKTQKENFKKLSRTNILTNFVKSNNGSWDHQKWEELLALLKEKGYSPIDPDKVGLLLEAKKAAYWEKIS